MNIEYDSTNVRSPALHELQELWRYRDLLRMLVSNSIKTRYKRSALGVVWTLLNPLLTTLVLTIALSFLLRFHVQNYPVYLLVGLIFWNFFSQTTIQSMNMLVWGSGLLKRIYIPRTVFAVSVVGNGLVNLLLSLIPLAVIMLAMGHPITELLIILPLPVLLYAMFTLGVALLVSTLAVFFVDVVDMYGILLSALFYLTPVIYPISAVPEEFVRYIKWNPMNIIIEVFRAVIYYGEAPEPLSLAIFTLLAFGTLGFGWWVFAKKVDELAYRI